MRGLSGGLLKYTYPDLIRVGIEQWVEIDRRDQMR
jgi:hypothetical protein